MKRNDIIQKLIKEGFSEKTLVNFSDKQIKSLANRILGEEEKTTEVVTKIDLNNKEDQDKYVAKKADDGTDVKIKNNQQGQQNESKSKVCKKCGKKLCECGKGTMSEKLVGNQKKIDKNHNGKIDAQDFKILKGQKKDVKEEKPSAGLSKEKKSEVVKKAKSGGDIGKKGKGFKDVEKAAKKSGAKNPKAVAAAAMWKNIKRENEEVKEWVNSLAESNYHPLTSKGEIMELIVTKLNENNPAPSKPGKDAPVREKPTTKPGKPKKENPFEPKHTPKPKALKEEGEDLPDFMKFKNLGIKFKDEK